MVQVSVLRQDTCLHSTDASARWAALSTIASAVTHVDSIILGMDREIGIGLLQWRISAQGPLHSRRQAGR